MVNDDGRHKYAVERFIGAEEEIHRAVDTQIVVGNADIAPPNVGMGVDVVPAGVGEHGLGRQRVPDVGADLGVRRDSRFDAERAMDIANCPVVLVPVRDLRLEGFLDNNEPLAGNSARQVEGPRTSVGCLGFRHGRPRQLTIDLSQKVTNGAFQARTGSPILRKALSWERPRARAKRNLNDRPPSARKGARSKATRDRDRFRSTNRVTFATCGSAPSSKTTTPFSARSRAQ